MKGIFGRFRLRTNVTKMVGMTCQTCHMTGRHLEVAYRRMMKGEGLSYRTLQRERLLYPYCSMDLADRSLAAHRQYHHGIGRGTQWWKTPPPADPQLYRVSFPKTMRLVEYPLEVYMIW